MNPGASTYGSVDKGETNEPEDATFDAENTYYLKDSGRRLTLKKLMLIAVPILAAILIMGGAALFLYRDFNHLYPGAQGDAGSKVRSSSSSPHVSSSDAESSSSDGKKTPPLRISTHSNSSSASAKSKEAETDDFPPAKSGGGDGSSAACWDHVKCAEKGLLGDCCPTAVGDMLFCCTEK